jgi:hypothetical protein
LRSTKFHNKITYIEFKEGGKMLSTYKHSYNTHLCTEESKILLHVWIHYDWELFLSEIERKWAETYVRGRLRASGFHVITDYTYNTHLHIGIIAKGKMLSVKELEKEWDDELFGPLKNEARKEWLCRAGADLPKLMKSILVAMVKKFNKKIRPGRKGTMLARSYQACKITDEFLAECGGDPVRAIGAHASYLECQGSDGGTAITPLDDKNSRIGDFSRNGKHQFRSEEEAQSMLQNFIGEEEIRTYQARIETDKNSPNFIQLYFATVADNCVIRSTKNALGHYAKRKNLKADDPELLRITQRLMDLVTQAREIRDSSALRAEMKTFSDKDRHLRRIYYCLAELIDFIAREGRPRPPPEIPKASA